MGIHKNLLSNPSRIPRELMCPLCDHVLHHPYQVQCSEEHVFCKACLVSYVDECNQEIIDAQTENTTPPVDTLATAAMDAKTGSQPHSQPPAQSQEALMDPCNRSDMETQKLAQTPSIPMSDVVVECPECKQLQDQSEWVQVSSFRPAKFAERMLLAQNIRCPTTMAKTCQWIGPMKDMEQHLSVCGFAVEYTCPHQQLGCTFRGTAVDMADHVPSCLFCALEDSVSSNSQNDLATIPMPLSGRLLSPPQSSPALCPMTPHNHHQRDNYGQQQPEGQIHDIDEALTQVVENTRISQHFTDGLRSLSSQSFQASQPHQPCDDDMFSLNKPDAVVMEKEEVDQDSISGLFEDMEMADMTISPTTTPLPTRGTQIQKHEQEQETHTTPNEPLSVTPTRRRRFIIEEESETENEYTHSQQQQEETSPECSLSHENKALAAKRSRVLQEIRLPLSAAVLEPSPASSPSPLVADASSILSIDDTDLINDFERPTSSAQPIRVRHKLQLRLRRQSAPQSSSRSSQESDPRRTLQFQGPWHWQVQRRTGLQLQSRSQPSPAVTMADLSSFTAPVGPPSASESGVERSRYFALTQSSSFRTAAPSAYLPLLAYEPRYLKSRRKKSLRDRTPIVHPRPGQGARTYDPMTPDITSPENSLATQVSFI